MGQIAITWLKFSGHCITTPQRVLSEMFGAPLGVRLNCRFVASVNRTAWHTPGNKLNRYPVRAFFWLGKNLAPPWIKSVHGDALKWLIARNRLPIVPSKILSGHRADGLNQLRTRNSL
jgi:hypothetical protein